MMQTYAGSCHCGAVRFEVQLDLTQPSYRCNCTICRRSRFWAAVARPAQFHLLAGEEMLTRYQFGRGNNHHQFCKQCGVRPFGIGNDTPIGPMIGVNLGCLDGVDDERLSQIPIVRIDGLHDRMEAPAFCSHL